MVFGAILARKVGEYALENNINLNYPLIGASGYSGLMVWHGGLSGSIPLKIAESNHFSEIISNQVLLDKLPLEGINFSETVFSTMNLTTSILLLILIPAVLFYIGKIKPAGVSFEFKKSENPTIKKEIIGAERIDYSQYFSKFIGGLFKTQNPQLDKRSKQNEYTIILVI